MSKRIPTRMCVGCRQMKEKSELIRVVRMQDSVFCVDDTGKKNGRGAYVCRNPECLELAMRNHGLERSFRTKVPAETAVQLKKEMSAIVK